MEAKQPENFVGGAQYAPPPEHLPGREPPYVHYGLGPAKDWFLNALQGARP